ncbi:ATP-dependent DNA helicase [Anaerobacillus sp. MEB173]|uniref:ATP-dependent DNA helicase n=1 Tax=Anaerobacillus sp. MEB173 TaxID=3383345 RepID=UPI003F9331F2
MNKFESLPFSYDKTQSFFDKLGEWVGDVFYDILPEAGFELRDEQVFMAFQLERAFIEKKVIFAEAGVGTGKTIVYLLYAICYARYMRKPAIIACADESLIEQLVKPEGDIAKLAKHLGLNIDVRLAKSQDQYLCLQKLDTERNRDDYDELYDEIYEELPPFVTSNAPLQSFYHYGDRKNYPDLNNEKWEKIGWDTFQDCFVCEQRHRCGQTLTREHYRKATDLIICSHDFYMEHVWTYDSRKREGQLPLLPEASSIVFDEGHLLEFAAQKALTYKLRHEVLEELLSRLSENDTREEFAVLIDETISQSLYFFHTLRQQIIDIPGSHRKNIKFNEMIVSEVKHLKSLLTRLEDELVFESELYTIDQYQLRIVEEHIEMIQKALQLFIQRENLISWVTEDQHGLTLVIMPRLVEEVLKERVFSKKIPVVFSSATLSSNDSFEYMANSIGVEDYLSFSVSSPFDYETKMEVYSPELTSEDIFTQKYNYANQLIEETKGRALILFNQEEELLQFKQKMIDDHLDRGIQFLFEGDQEISQLISTFQREETSCLAAVHLWEGLDIPGPSLVNVIIWSLPFPPNDPVFMAKRQTTSNPYQEVDLPYMILRLRQGIGRLIRTHNDSGIVSIFDERIHFDPELKSMITSILPKGVQLNKSI